MLKNIKTLSLALVENALEEAENEAILDDIKKYTTKEDGVVGKYFKKATDSILASIGEWLKNGLIIICNYAGGVCLIVGSLGIVGMMADSDNKMGCKKYVIGSLLVYIGIKCLLLMII